MNGLAQFKKYESYKDSGVEWIGEIPNEWTLVKLVDLADLNIANSFTDGDWIEDEFITDEGIRLIQTGNVGTGFFVDKETKKYISEESFKKLKCKDVIAGDILICRLADPTGRSCIVPSNEERMITSVDVVILRSKKSYDTRFLNYYFNSSVNLYVCKLFEQGSTRKRISRKNLGFIKVLNPCYEEQIQIANFLDRETAKLDGLISKKQRLIELLKEKRQALITQAVTKGLDPNAKMKDSGIEWIGEIPEKWKITKIKNVFKIIGSGATPRSTNDEYFEGDIPWLNTGDLNDGLVEVTSNHISMNAKRSTSALKMYPSNSLIIAMYGATIGKLGITNFETTTNQACCIMSYPIDAELMFLYYWLLVSRKEIINKAQGGTQPNISQQTIKSLTVILPSIEEQVFILEKLEFETIRIHKLIEKLHSQITKIQEYRQAVITAAVTGKIDVRDEVILSQEREGKPLE
jgi:type I restriction enzyme S subunit